MSDNEPTTKPTLETLLEMLRGMREETRVGFALMERRFDDVGRKIDVMNKDVLQLRADVAGLDRRLSNLEESRV
jgi:polyhydroxyalkanoate synthesis regulator phasin